MKSFFFFFFFFLCAAFCTVSSDSHIFFFNKNIKSGLYTKFVSIHIGVLNFILCTHLKNETLERYANNECKLTFWTLFKSDITQYITINGY